MNLIFPQAIQNRQIAQFKEGLHFEGTGLRMKNEKRERHPVSFSIGAKIADTSSKPG
jgi:hypothetical protein